VSNDNGVYGVTWYFFLKLSPAFFIAVHGASVTPKRGNPSTRLAANNVLEETTGKSMSHEQKKIECDKKMLLLAGSKVSEKSVIFWCETEHH
jgi:hypothetical protein